MKIKLLIVMAVIIIGTCFSVSAQDPGVRDTVALTLSVDTLALTAQVQVYVYSDEDLIGGSIGVRWVNTNMQVDTAYADPVLENGFNLVVALYESDSKAVTNANYRFITGGAALGAGIPAEPSGRRLWATYDYVLSTWGGIDNDGIRLDTSEFSPGSAFLLVGVGTNFQPVWEGEIIYGNPAGVRFVEESTLPNHFSLGQNYPNPFNPTTDISFDIPVNSHVNLTVYNVLGQEVKRIINRDMAAGRYVATWDGKTQSGKAVSSGVYFYKLEAGDFSDTKKMMILK